MLKTFKYQIGSVGLFAPPSSSPIWKRKRTLTLEGSFFSFTPRGLKKGVEGFAAALSLTAATAFLQLSHGTSLFTAANTSESLFAHVVERFAPRVNLQQQKPHQWAALVNQLKR